MSERSWRLANVSNNTFQQTQYLSYVFLFLSIQQVFFLCFFLHFFLSRPEYIFLRAWWLSWYVVTLERNTNINFVALFLSFRLYVSIRFMLCNRGEAPTKSHVDDQMPWCMYKKNVFRFLIEKFFYFSRNFYLLILVLTFNLAWLGTKNFIFFNLGWDVSSKSWEPW